MRTWKNIYRSRTTATYNAFLIGMFMPEGTLKHVSLGNMTRADKLSVNLILPGGYVGQSITSDDLIWGEDAIAGENVSWDGEINIRPLTIIQGGYLLSLIGDNCWLKAILEED